MTIPTSKYLRIIITTSKSDANFEEKL